MMIMPLPYFTIKTTMVCLDKNASWNSSLSPMDFQETHEQGLVRLHSTMLKSSLNGDEAIEIADSIKIDSTQTQ